VLEKLGACVENTDLAAIWVASLRNKMRQLLHASGKEVFDI
jgi:hypothetical protein